MKLINTWEFQQIQVPERHHITAIILLRVFLQQSKKVEYKLDSWALWLMSSIVMLKSNFSADFQLAVL